MSFSYMWVHTITFSNPLGHLRNWVFLLSNMPRACTTDLHHSKIYCAETVFMCLRSNLLYLYTSYSTSCFGSQVQKRPWMEGSLGKPLLTDIARTLHTGVVWVYSCLQWQGGPHIWGQSWIYLYLLMYAHAWSEQTVHELQEQWEASLKLIMLLRFMD